MTTDSRAAFEAYCTQQGFTPSDLAGPLHELSTCWDECWSARQGEIDALRSALELARDYLYNPFEPDNQSNSYKRVCAALSPSAIGGAKS